MRVYRSGCSTGKTRQETLTLIDFNRKFKKMIEKIQLIIGRAVLGSGSEDTILLAKLVYYLNGQMILIKKDCEPETKDYIDSVLEIAESFLNEDKKPSDSEGK